MEAQVCLGFRLNVPFWCGFRDPSSSNLHRTFPLPPPATLYGMAAAALGLRQDDQSRRSEMRFAVAIEKQGEQVESYSKWMKASEPAKGPEDKLAREAIRSRGNLSPDEAEWVSTTLIRQKIIQPVFIAGLLTGRDTAEEVMQALRSPFFPLCLGESDDAVDVEILGIEKPEPSQAPATGAVGGVHPGGALASLPTRFDPLKRGKWRLQRWLVTIPFPGGPLPSNNSPQRMACHGQVWDFEPGA